MPVASKDEKEEIETKPKSPETKKPHENMFASLDYYSTKALENIRLEKRKHKHVKDYFLCNPILSGFFHVC